MKKNSLLTAFLALLILAGVFALVVAFGMKTNPEQWGQSAEDTHTTIPPGEDAGTSEAPGSSDFEPVFVTDQDNVTWKTKSASAAGLDSSGYLAYFTVELEPGATYRVDLDMKFLTIEDEGAGYQKYGFDIDGITCWEGDSDYIFSDIKEELNHTYGKFYFATPEDPSGSVTVNIYMQYAYDEYGFEDYPPGNDVDFSFDLYRVK